jgi:hypothetical protein
LYSCSSDLRINITLTLYNLILYQFSTTICVIESTISLPILTKLSWKNHLVSAGETFDNCFSLSNA